MTKSLAVEEHPAGVVLDRPERLNALSAALMDELTASWVDLARREDLRCVVLTGNGRAFCAGADTGLLASDRAPRGAGLDGELSFVPGRVLEVPVVVAVNGVCAGGGLHFVADADIVIAATSASFVDRSRRAGGRHRGRRRRGGRTPRREPPPAFAALHAQGLRRPGRPRDVPARRAPQPHPLAARMDGHLRLVRGADEPAAPG